MDCPRKEDFEDGGKADGSDRQDRPLDDGGAVGGSAGPSDAAAQGSGRVSGGLAERLEDAVRDGGDGDLLLDRDDVENGVLQWVRALDLQVLGACRADERLKPLLKLNVSSGVAEDRLMSQLTQHFEASEVGMLARCLCFPLVSIRVGRVNKQGNLLCPSAARGHLKLAFLPSSDMRLLFSGDDGCNEGLGLVSRNAENSGVLIEEISADSSGRSFLLRLPGDRVSYFWCSEKSKLVGAKLLSKMKDLLRRKPSLCQLTGICESRLDSFATHLRAYLLGSAAPVEASLTASTTFIMPANILPESDPSSQSLSMSSRCSPIQYTVGDIPMPQSPRLNTVKDGLQRNSSSLRSVTREKLAWLGDSHSNLVTISNLPVTTSISDVTWAPSTSQFNHDKSQEGSLQHNVPPLHLPEVSGLSSLPSSFAPLSFSLPPSQVPAMSSPHFSPYYCWCPPFKSSLQCTATPPKLPSLASESMPLPPLSSFFSTASPSVSFVPLKPPLDLAEPPTVDLPPVFPETLIRFPLPASSFISIPSSQQTLAFSPFISDPIVHIPIIDVCSSGQGYLVSAGPAISSAVPPLLPSFVNPLRPETDSMAEKNARETLRMLMASAPTSTQLMKVLPPVLTSIDGNLSHGTNQVVVVAGSRGLYSGTLDIDAVANGVCSVGVGMTSSSPSRIVGVELLHKEAKISYKDEGFHPTDELDHGGE